jgi:fission 1 protein
LNHPCCFRYVKAFLEIEPNNLQVSILDVSNRTLIHDTRLLSLLFQEYIEKEMKRELKKDAAMAGGALLAIGGIVGLAFALAKK